MGNDSMLQQLLEAINDIDLNDHIFKFPLHFDTEIKSNLFSSMKYGNSKVMQWVNQKDKEEKSALYYAGINEHWDSACTLLLYGADCNNLSDDKKKVLLCFAAQETHFHYAKTHRLRPIVGLLSLYVPDVVQHYGDTYEYPRLLSYFYAYGHTKVINALLGSIENIERRKLIANYADNHKKPYICIIVENRFSDQDYLKIVNYFFVADKQQGIKVDAEEGRQILFYAAIQGHLQTCKYLIEQGKVEIIKNSNYNACTLAYRAAEKNHTHIIKYLWSLYREKALDQDGRTLLHAIASSGNCSILDYLFAQGARAQVTDNNQRSALYYTIEMGYTNASKLLIEKYGVDFIKLDIHRNTALDQAIEKKQWNLVNCLLKKDAHTCSKSYPHIKKFFELTSQDKTLLHSAICTRESSLIQFLLQQNIAINNLDQTGRTPLHLAAFIIYEDNSKTVECLLQQGARYNVMDNNRKTALDLSKSRRSFSNAKITRLLQLLDSLFTSESLATCLKDNFFQERNVQKPSPYGTWYPDVYDGTNPMRFIINAKNKQGETLLHRAAEINDLEALECLLHFDRGYITWIKNCSSPFRCEENVYNPLNINAFDDQKNTPLHRAAQLGHIKIVHLLLSEGAIFNLENNQKNTPKKLAENNKQMEIMKCLQIVEDLFSAAKQGLKLTADSCILPYIHAKDSNGMTLLHHMAAQQQKEPLNQVVNKSTFFYREYSAESPANLKVVESKFY